MRIGIIAEGSTDQAVLTNILQGLGFEDAEVVPLRPELATDKTDKNYNKLNTFGGWEYVKQDCLDQTKLDNFFLIGDHQYMIVQLDTGEVDQNGSGIQRPQKSNNPNYVEELRNLVIAKINEWLNGNYKNQLLYAVCIEEMEAWVLTLYDDRDTVKSANPKDKLKHQLKIKFKEGDKEFYQAISKDFRHRKTLLVCSKRNHSLQLFVDSITAVCQTLVLRN
jgi:hypothetical protein